MKQLAFLAVFGTSLCAVSTSHAQDANEGMGKSIAEEYCSECHNVGPDGPFKLDPPSFAAIAKFRTPEQIWIRIVLPRNHRMPRYKEFMIGNNIDDMVAYIASLE